MKSLFHLINNKGEKGFRFIPDREFYNTVSINRKRWGQLYRGEKEPTVSELKAIAKYFEFEINQII